MNFRTNIFLVGLLFLSCFVNAQTVLLFQIPSSDVQIAAAESVGNEKAVTSFKRSDNQIKHAIIKDFRANYSFGPIYFFATKDADNVIDKKFDQVTFYDKSAKKVELPNIGTNYCIANVGLYTKETVLLADNKDEQVLAETGGENHLGLGIILRKADYTAVTGKLRFSSCKIGKRGSIFNKKKRYYVFIGSYLFNRRMMKFFDGAKTAR